MGDAEYLRLVGLDAYLLFRFTRLCCLISVEFMVLGMFILTPIYLNGNNGMTNLNRITVSNLKANSSALIAPLILSWVYCFHFFWVVGKEMDILAKLRRDFFAQGDPGFDRQTSYTAIVEDIPPSLSNGAVLRAYMQELFKNDICFVSVVQDLGSIKTLQDKRDKALEMLEAAIMARDNKAHGKDHENSRNILKLDEKVRECEERLRVLQKQVEIAVLQHNECKRIAQWESEKSMCAFTAEKNSAESNEHVLKLELFMERFVGECDGPHSSTVIPLTANNLTHEPQESKYPKLRAFWRPFKVLCLRLVDFTLFFVRGAIDVMFHIMGFTLTFIGIKSCGQDLMGNRDDVDVKTGFVTFRTLASKIIACEVIISNFAGIIVGHAPEARDIIWRNVCLPRKTILWRNVVFNTCLFVFGLFWSSMVGLIINFRNFLWDWGGGSVFPEYLQTLFFNYFVTLILLSIIQLLPILFRVVSYNFIREKSSSEIERRLLSRFFSFQVVNVLFIISGANFLDIIKTPRQFFEILGTDIPTVATYAATIIIIKLLAGLPLYLLRIVNFLRTVYLHLATNPELRTSRDWRRGAALPPIPLYGNVYPSMLMTMLLSFTYSILAPFVSIFAVMFFAAAGIIFKFLGIWVYLPNFESGGSFSRRLFWTLCISIIASQFSFMGFLFFADHDWLFIVCIFPLPILVIIWALFKDRKLQKASKVLSLEIAVYIDRCTCDKASHSGATQETDSNQGEMQEHSTESLLKISSNDLSKFKMFRDDIYCQPELQHVFVEPELSGVWEPALDNDHGDDLDENIYDTSEYQHRTGYYKQSRTLDPPPVPGWVKRNKSDLSKQQWFNRSLSTNFDDIELSRATTFPSEFPQQGTSIHSSQSRGTQTLIREHSLASVK